MRHVCPPLILAIQNGDRGAIERQLVSCNVRDEIQFPSRRTALHYAAAKGLASVVRTLVAKKADVNAQDLKLGWTALHDAAYKRRWEVAHLLLEFHADVRLRSANGSLAYNLAPFEFLKPNDGNSEEIVSTGQWTAQMAKAHSGSLQGTPSKKLDQRTSEGDTLLHLSIRKRKADNIAYIIETLPVLQSVRNCFGLLPADVERLQEEASYQLSDDEEEEQQAESCPDWDDIFRCDQLQSERR